MKRIIFLVLAAFIFIGCASVDKDKVQRDVKSINKADGVDQQEAIIIAQDYLIQHGAEKYWRAGDPKVRNYGDFWSVEFGPKYFFAVDYEKGRPIEILVLKSTGDIPPEEDLKFR